MKIIEYLIITIIAIKSLFKKEENNNPKRLDKQSQPKPLKLPQLNYTNILIILGFIIIFIIVCWFVFRVGAMESTQVYNRGFGV